MVWNNKLFIKKYDVINMNCNVSRCNLKKKIDV